MDDVANDIQPQSVSLDFWAKSGDEMRAVHVELSESGSLAPLFFAFGLVSKEEYLESRDSSAHADQDLLEWLREMVDQAVEVADKHYALKTRINEARALLETKYELAEIQVKAAGTLADLPELFVILSELRAHGQKVKGQLMRVLERSSFNLHSSGECMFMCLVWARDWRQQRGAEPSTGVSPCSKPWIEPDL